MQPTDRSQPQRIVLAGEGTRGDLYPIFALAEGLARRGHEVRVCGPPDFSATAAERGLDYHPVGPDIREFLTQAASRLSGSALSVARAGEQLFVESAKTYFRELPAAMEGADAVVAGGTQMVAASVAEAMGARYHYVAYYPGLFPTAEAPPALVPFQRMPRWANRAAWWLSAKALRRSLGATLDAGRRSLGLPPMTDLFGYVLGPDPLLATDPELAPPPTDTRYAPRSVGCLHPFVEEPLPPKLDAFLDAGEPPVYLGFGSMTDPDPVKTTDTVLEAVERAGVRAVLSEGWAGLGRAALPENVMVVGATSHPTLFQRVAAVAHHGGAGTTTTAARAGAPQILVPHLLDQFWWSHRVEQLGLGPPALPRRRLSAEALAERLAAIRDNEFLAERARDLGTLLRRAAARREDPAALLTR